MRRYWLLDQHDGDGPTALVATDGALRIVDIIEFGPGITSVEEQQELWNRLIGAVAPNMKPLVAAASISVDGEQPADELRRDEGMSVQSRRRGGRGKGAKAGHDGRRGRHGPNRSGSSGQR